MNPAPDCDTCTEPGSGVKGECPMSMRSCGHHCNCVWTQDVCHWCRAEINEDGDLIPNFAPVEHADAVRQSLADTDAHYRTHDRTIEATS